MRATRGGRGRRAPQTHLTTTTARTPPHTDKHTAHAHAHAHMAPPLNPEGGEPHARAPPHAGTHERRRQTDDGQTDKRQAAKSAKEKIVKSAWGERQIKRIVIAGVIGERAV